MAKMVIFPVTSFIGMFKHPYEHLFRKKIKNSNVIIEVLVEKNLINKGEYFGIRTKNEEELDSLTISNIIQYAKKEGELFKRGLREVNVFPVLHSEMTIPFSKIENMNVTCLSYDTFRWDFTVSTEASLKNTVWYLRILLKNNLSRFQIEDIKPEISLQFSMQFFFELLNLINENYSKPKYKLKLASLFTECLKILIPLHKTYKEEKVNFTVEELERSEFYLSKIANLLIAVRRHLRNETNNTSFQ